MKDKLLQSFSFVAAAVLVVTANLFTLTPLANASNLLNPNIIIAETNPIDQAFGAGTTNQIQGKAKQDIGTVEKTSSEVKGQLEEAKNQVQSAAKQVEGRAQQDIGRVKNRVDQASSDLEDASNNLGDAFNHLFNR